jgi:hypothetical protein
VPFTGDIAKDPGCGGPFVVMIMEEMDEMLVDRMVQVREKVRVDLAGSKLADIIKFKVDGPKDESRVILVGVRDIACRFTDLSSIDQETIEGRVTFAVPVRRNGWLMTAILLLLEDVMDKTAAVGDTTTKMTEAEAWRVISSTTTSSSDVESNDFSTACDFKTVAFIPSGSRSNAQTVLYFGVS